MIEFWDFFGVYLKILALHTLVSLCVVGAVFLAVWLYWKMAQIMDSGGR